jgi:hypothetical protein
MYHPARGRAAWTIVTMTWSRNSSAREFSTIFLTTAKVIISALLIFAALGVIGTFVAVFVGWLSLR